MNMRAMKAQGRRAKAHGLGQANGKRLEARVVRGETRTGNFMGFALGLLGPSAVALGPS
jgi:hypothetical protein